MLFGKAKVAERSGGSTNDARSLFAGWWDGIIRLNTRFLLGVKDRDGECSESGRVRAVR